MECLRTWCTVEKLGFEKNHFTTFLSLGTLYCFRSEEGKPCNLVLLLFEEKTSHFFYCVSRPFRLEVNSTVTGVTVGEYSFSIGFLLFSENSIDSSFAFCQLNLVETTLGGEMMHSENPASNLDLKSSFPFHTKDGRRHTHCGVDNNMAWVIYIGGF